jgi:hypothetical protein
MIVDSCMNEAGDCAVALDYLRGLDVDVGKQVTLLVVTHWHDDHIRGFAQIVRAARSARFACSAALNCGEFFTLVSCNQRPPLVEQLSGVTEFSEILDSFARRKGQRNTSGPDAWAQHGNRLYHRARKESAVTVWALSPSAQTCTDAKISLARLMPGLGPPRGRLPNPGPNDLSTALLVHTANVHILLGSDLEAGKSEARGWRAIVNSSIPELNLPSSIYKVPHHGSVNADVDEVWTQLLIDDPLAVLTPYARGAKPLPSESDVVRLKRRTNNLFCTAWPPTKSPDTREAAVERTMREVALTRRAIRKRPGHVRFRFPLSGGPNNVSCELFDGACRL